jgi:hypothetical protein
MQWVTHVSDNAVVVLSVELLDDFVRLGDFGGRGDDVGRWGDHKLDEIK